MSLAPTRAKVKHPHPPIKSWAPPSKAARKVNHPVPKKEAVQPTVLRDSSARAKVTELPHFMQAAWSTAFLPTLYDSLVAHHNHLLISPRDQKWSVNFKKQLILYGLVLISKYNGQMCHALR